MDANGWAIWQSTLVWYIAKTLRNRGEEDYCIFRDLEVCVGF